MSNTVSVHLCCNDPDNGGFAGKLAAVEFTDDCEFLSLHGDLLDGEDMAYDFEAGTFTVMGEAYRMMSQRCWTGNWCWDTAVISRHDAASLANRLRAKPYWGCEVACERLYDKWERGDTFVAGDFAGDEK